MVLMLDPHWHVGAWISLHQMQFLKLRWWSTHSCRLHWDCSALHQFNQSNSTPAAVQLQIFEIFSKKFWGPCEYCYIFIKHIVAYCTNLTNLILHQLQCSCKYELGYNLSAAEEKPLPGAAMRFTAVCSVCALKGKASRKLSYLIIVIFGTPPYFLGLKKVRQKIV